VLHHQPIRPSQADAAGQRLFDSGQKAEQNKSDQDGEQRQKRAQFFPFQIAPN
jgi:hypothetical protein